VRILTWHAATVGSEGTLPMPDAVATALRELKTRQKRERLTLSRPWDKTTHVCSVETGKAVLPRTYTGWFHRIRIVAELPRITHSEELPSGPNCTVSPPGYPERTPQRILNLNDPLVRTSSRPAATQPPGPLRPRRSVTPEQTTEQRKRLRDAAVARSCRRHRRL